ncbi:MAG TPA: tyrosine-type recombinase/integrase [Chthonomonadaceae bacterium]|nr:tyrosine-type recombinase/integrase [Chthonomonadaceae bacterium]
MESSIERCVQRYLHFLRTIGRHSTQKTYGNHLRVWMRWLDDAGLETEEGTKITRTSQMHDANSFEVVAAFYAYLKVRRKADGGLLHNNAIRSFQHAIRALWRFCNDQKMWAPAPAPLTFNAAAPVPMVAHVENHRERATVEQVGAMLDACDRLPSARECALAYAVLQVLLIAGIRRNELIHLEVSDYNRESRTLYVRVAKGGTPRTQRLDAETCAALDRWLAVRGEYICGRWKQLPNRGWQHIPDADAPDYMFVNSQKRHLADAGITSLFKRLRIVAGFRENVTITPHVLRHLQGTRIYQVKGVRAAQKFLGHKSERTTWRYIAPTSDQEMDEVLTQVQLRPKHQPATLQVTMAQAREGKHLNAAAPRTRLDLRKQPT